MNEWAIIVNIVVLLVATCAFIWVVFSLNGTRHKKAEEDLDFASAAEKDIEHIFNDDFREELRNRGRLHFEKIIGENAMFLQQDLRLTTSQLNEYMKQEITRSLQEEFVKYEQSITDAKQLAIESIQKTQQAVEEQRQVLREQVIKELAAERDRMVGRFEQNLADIVNHYVLLAIGNQIDLNDQLEYILGDISENKDEIISDINSGA